MNMGSITGYLKLSLVMALFLSPVFSGDIDWEYKLDGEVVTSAQLEKDYESFLALMALQLGVSPETLSDYAGRADEIQDPSIRAILSQVDEEAFKKQYSTVLLLVKDAKKTGFFDRPENIEKKRFFAEYLLAQIYLGELVGEYEITIEDDELLERWGEEKKKNENLRTVPIDQGLVYMKQMIMQEKKQLIQNTIVTELKNRYKFELRNRKGK